MKPHADYALNDAVIEWRFEEEIVDRTVRQVATIRERESSGRDHVVVAPTGADMVDGASHRVERIADKIDVVERFIRLLGRLGLTDLLDESDREVVADSGILLRYLADEPITGREYNVLDDTMVVDSLGGWGTTRSRSQTVYRTRPPSCGSLKLSSIANSSWSLVSWTRSRNRTRASLQPPRSAGRG